MSPTCHHQKSARARDSQSRQPQSHMCRVTLHVSQPSAPDPLPPTSPPPPEVHHIPQTPPLPPHLPPTVAGLPIPNDGQHSLGGLPTNIPPTYAHPYGAVFYPPAYPPVPRHHPYSASTGAAPLQPWGYTQYPMAPPPAPFLAHPSVSQHATTSGGDGTAHEAHGCIADGPVDQDTSGHGDMGVSSTYGGVGMNGAALLSTAGAQPGRSYPNKEVSHGGKYYVPSRWEVIC